jgi:hypothetical protein
MARTNPGRAIDFGALAHDFYPPGPIRGFVDFFHNLFPPNPIHEVARLDFLHDLYPPSPIHGLLETTRLTPRHRSDAQPSLLRLLGSMRAVC